MNLFTYQNVVGLEDKPFIALDFELPRIDMVSKGHLKETVF